VALVPFDARSGFTELAKLLRVSMERAADIGDLVRYAGGAASAIVL
jgi:hypothetical protein